MEDDIMTWCAVIFGMFKAQTGHATKSVNNEQPYNDIIH